ncbi:hypothetical protein PHYBLDRAFT_152794 [Phycomyces blakesleeanus NRRL 1555(-)]|uniref:Uncharacterized protein n=1 Tax=Phycomyces blakesleeanus (strain ATCC 8743b / DSM 1359 / FGSC 10004 / NBRC 33097 / NRRL 1555) TaxID=763407 RepID=A0A163CX10_PHYB8|nr:hypothetical protein PHYBLDRAFT_152794 [Phycomyces blakesleeanus NRRL 1555(-)]OAD66220.1 hypothetical protein PHYBLDRAFT_152794 [Phycomyces blakesleeanus NRRL 1555(-)]|eukprot:XP_018284260.1 hypothetical protein PHYBLDRAFT_152794 [Phycomyces blakesleeanus NRRL 1555(-)]
MPEFLLANQDDDYTEFSFENNNQKISQQSAVNSGVIPSPSAASSADHNDDTMMTPSGSEDGASDSEKGSSGSDDGCSSYKDVNSLCIHLDNSGVRVNNNLVVTMEMLLASAEKDLNTKKSNYYAALDHYLGVSKRDPTSTAAKSASKSARKVQELFAEAEQILKNLKASTAHASKPHDKKSTLVLSNIPFLQLRSENLLVKANHDVFNSVYDFCQEFTTNKLKGKAYNWKETKSILLDHYDMPFHKFLNMGRVWCMKQDKDESARSFGTKFQKFYCQALLDDSVQFVLCFCTKMPSKIEEIILLFQDLQKVLGYQEDHEEKHLFLVQGAWSKGHSCPEREKYLTKVSRMAVRSSAGRPIRASTVVEGSPLLSCSEYQDNTSALTKIVIHCMYTHISGWPKHILYL